MKDLFKIQRDWSNENPSKYDDEDEKKFENIIRKLNGKKFLTKNKLIVKRVQLWNLVLTIKGKNRFEVEVTVDKYERWFKKKYAVNVDATHNGKKKIQLQYLDSNANYLLDGISSLEVNIYNFVKCYYLKKSPLKTSDFEEFYDISKFGDHRQFDW